MTNMVRLGLSLLAVGASTCLVSACSVESTPGAWTREAQLEVIGDLRAVEPRVIRTEEINVLPAQANRLAIPDFVGTPIENPSEKRLPPSRLARIFEVASGTVKIVEFDEVALEALSQELGERGFGEPVDGSDQYDGAPSEGDDYVEKGISNFYDSRVNLKGKTANRYRRTGQVLGNGGCTGTLVGRRLVLTAAHCIVDSQGNYYSPTFKPHSSSDGAPYGTWSVEAAVWGGNYNGCQFWNECVPEDWAILILHDSFPLGHPGWLGYAYRTDESKYVTEFDSKRNYGYPGCGLNYSPHNCVDGDPFGQEFNCTIGDFRWPYANGYNSTFTHGCDTSPGHSGGAILDIDTGRVLGVMSTEMCGRPPAVPECYDTSLDLSVSQNPNLAKRLGSYIVGLLNNFRTQYP